MICTGFVKTLVKKKRFCNMEKFLDLDSMPQINFEESLYIPLTTFPSWTSAGVQPWWIQGIRSGDGVGEDQETIA